MNTIFLLSPARLDGKRAKVLLNTAATFDLAMQLRSDQGAPLGDVFSFLSGLYFRGKLAYARAFGRPSDDKTATYVITTDRGLVSPDVFVSREDLAAFARIDLALGDARFVAPLRRDAERISQDIDPTAQVVLLGSIATGKYVDTLSDVYGERLLYPADFVGRGDMSRGGLMLRCVAEGRELTYVPVRGAARRGKRPPKLDRLPRSGNRGYPAQDRRERGR
ncbi:MAG: hypothetical protein ACT4P7_15470 [Gemmatimonadaceae bacterium]